MAAVITEVCSAHAAFVLDEWRLDLDAGTVVLVAAGVPGVDFSGLDCSKFTIISNQ